MADILLTVTDILFTVADILLMLALIMNKIDHDSRIVTDYQSVAANNHRKVVNILRMQTNYTRATSHSEQNVHDIQCIFCHLKPNLHDNGQTNINFSRFAINLRRAATGNFLI